MNWLDSINWEAITPAAFANRLKRRLKYPIDPGELIMLYNRIVEEAGENPTAVGAFADKAVDVFKRRGEPDQAALFLELSARSWMQAGEVTRGLEAAGAFLSVARTEEHTQDLVELADDLCGGVLSGSQQVELAPRVLAVAAAVYAKAKRPEKQVDAYLTAAGLFARHGALQAAYRAADDAEQIARQADSLPLLARVAQQAAIIAYNEQDFEWSAEAGRRALRCFTDLGEPPPVVLRINTAVAMMNAGAPGEALENLEAVLPALGTDDQEIKFQIYVNIAACCRLLKDLPRARDALIKARQSASPQCPAEARLELELVEARVMAEAAAPWAAVLALGRAVTCLDELMVSLNRLHYRRGMRERYVRRFESLLQTLPTQGSADDVLSAVAAIHGGLISDWMAILDWGAAVASDSSLPVAAASRASGLLQEMAKYGAPFVLGFREKYDDPWEPHPDRPWDHFVELAAQLASAGAPSPFAIATAVARAELLRQRLAQGYCIIALTFAGGASLWVLTGDLYQQLRFNFDELATFVAMRKRYEAAEVDRSAFVSALHRLRDLLLPKLGPVFDDIATSGSPGIIHLQDALNAVPMTMLAAEHEGLCRAMEVGEFEVHVVPAVHPSLGEEPLNRPHICAIRDDKDHLLLARHEAQTASSLMKASRLAVFAPNDIGGLLDDLTEAKLLIVSTHGSAISRYTDPIFGSLGGELGSHIISVDQIQTAFPWLPYRLALLNACHAGSGLARNFQHQFRTHDVASYPALLLLNRRSIVGAAAWRTPDMVSYIHLALTAIGLAEGLIPSRALSRATAKLRSLSKAETLDLLDLVPDPVARATAVRMIAAEPPAGMFNEPYFYGGFETYSLC